MRDFEAVAEHLDQWDREVAEGLAGLEGGLVEVAAAAAEDGGEFGDGGGDGLDGCAGVVSSVGCEGGGERTQSVWRWCTW